MIKLGVNIDHVATVRQARRTDEPDPIWAAVEAELGGADGITFHLREDRRHINDRDAALLRQTVGVKLNMEMAIAPDIVDRAAGVMPRSNVHWFPRNARNSPPKAAWTSPVCTSVSGPWSRGCAAPASACMLLS